MQVRWMKPRVIVVLSSCFSKVYWMQLSEYCHCIMCNIVQLIWFFCKWLAVITCLFCVWMVELSSAADFYCFFSTSLISKMHQRRKGKLLGIYVIYISPSFLGAKTQKFKWRLWVFSPSSNSEMCKEWLIQKIVMDISGIAASLIGRF